MASTNGTPKKRLTGLACAGLLLASACGGAGDSSSPAAAPSSSGLSSAFCEAKAALDAVSPDTPDEAALRRYQAETAPLLERLTAAAPAALAEPVATLRASTTEPTSLEEAAATATDEDVAAAKERIGIAVHQECGFTKVNFVAVDNDFEETPGTFAGGRSSVLLDNRGQALHALILFRVNDDVPDADVAGLVGSDDLESRATFINAMPAAGGHRAQLVVDLKPGRYVFFDDEHVDDMKGTFLVE